MESNRYIRFIKRASGRFALFATWSCGAFVGLILLAAVECATLWLVGVEYTPKSAVWRTFLSDISASANDRYGVTCVRSTRKSANDSFESDLVLHDLEEHTAMPLGLSRFAPSCVSMARDGDAIAFGCDDGSIYVCHVASDIESSEIRLKRSVQLLYRGVPGGFANLIISPNGEYIAAAGPESVCLLKTLTGELLHTWSVDDWEYGALLSFSDDSARLLSYSGGEIARLWETRTGLQIASVPSVGANVRGVVLSPDAQLARFIVGNGVVHTWNFADSELVRCDNSHSVVLVALPPIFSPDGRYLATATDSHTVELYTASSGERVGLFRGHECQVTGLVFGSDRRLYTRDVEGKIHAWKVDKLGNAPRVVAAERSDRSFAFEPLLSMGF